MLRATLKYSHLLLCVLIEVVVILHSLFFALKMNFSPCHNFTFYTTRTNRTALQNYYLFFNLQTKPLKIAIGFAYRFSPYYWRGLYSLSALGSSFTTIEIINGTYNTTAHSSPAQQRAQPTHNKIKLNKYHITHCPRPAPPKK